MWTKRAADMDLVHMERSGVGADPGAAAAPAATDPSREPDLRLLDAVAPRERGLRLRDWSDALPRRAA
ncbi:MAG: hypothetical protein KF817_09595 [Phycisphaeraceae bacterium]|nr:hypothetical protein [Phycisphaeraceae bacterium]